MFQIIQAGKSVRYGGSVLSCILLVTLTFLLPGSTFAEQKIPSSDKVAVTDGHVFHDVGMLWNHVSNWGLIGSAPSVGTPFSAAPSARWPGQDGHDHLWAGGLWVGGRVLGETLVSTGSFQSEFYPTEAAGDTIFATAHGAPGGQRYPWPAADDDQDGLEDEDPLNGVDDDGDGNIDEDFAAIGDQSFRCDYTDDSVYAQELYPDHTPLNIRVTQESYQWSQPRLENTIGYEFTVENIGVTDISQVYLGIQADFDIAPHLIGAENDQAGSWTGLIQTADGSWVTVDLAYMYDSDAAPPEAGYVGFVLCGHDTDPAGQTAPESVSPRNIQIYRGNATFDNGGDPSNDSERYELLADNYSDGNSWAPADYRVLMSCGPFANFPPLAELHFQVALVAGHDLTNLLNNAAEIIRVYQGLDFDRDGDPNNGAEFTVNWLPYESVPSPVDDNPIPAVAGLQLQTHPNPFNPTTTLTFELKRDSRVILAIHDTNGRLVRSLVSADFPAGTNEINWHGKDDRGQAVSSGVYLARLTVSGQSVVQKMVLLR